VSDASPRSGPIAALLTLLFLAVVLRTAWLSDDALITLRSVMNVTHGYGLTFNVAERVQTFTHPLWALLLTAAYLVVGNVYYATFALSILVSLIVFWLALRGAASTTQAWLAAAVLLLSRAFVDFSTSGLENPLSHLLLVLFAGVALSTGQDGRPRLTSLWLLASLLYLSRPDHVLFAAPILVAATVRHRDWSSAAPKVAIGLLPAVAWTMFAVVYYGFPFPNTAYAKLATGISRGEMWHQGFFYLMDSLDRDPVSLVTVLTGIGLGLTTRGAARGLAFGTLLYVVYVASIGGDFMAGRFVATPLFAAVLIVSRLVSLPAVRAQVVTAVLVVAGLSSARMPLLSDSTFDESASKPTGIVDERAIYFGTQSLMLADRSAFRDPEWTSGAPVPDRMDVLPTCGLMGSSGLAWGPMTHLLDECALADPLLARLPASFNHQWRPGHFRRVVPEGYVESLEQKTNLLADAALRRLYTDIRIVTRSRPLLSMDRFRAIWRVNVEAGEEGVNRRFYRYGGGVAELEDVAAVVADGTSPGEPGARVLTAPLAIFCEDRPGRRYLDVTLDSDDRYMLLFVKANRLVTTMELGPIPQHRRNPGLAAYTENLPPSATTTGFDTIIVAPLEGERFGFGHLLLDGFAPTDAELARRVAERDRLRPR